MFAAPFQSIFDGAAASRELRKPFTSLCGTDRIGGFSHTLSIPYALRRNAIASGAKEVNVLRGACPLRLFPLYTEQDTPQ